MTTKSFTLSWAGTEYYVRVKAENLTKAKIKFAKSENSNPLIVCDRIKSHKKPIHDDLITRYI